MAFSANADIRPINPPLGLTSNFGHPPSQAIEAYVGMGVCVGSALLFVFMRLYVKAIVTHQWGWDDWTCLTGFALIMALNAVAFTLMGPGKPIGLHFGDIRASIITRSIVQRSLAAINLYAAAAFFAKASLFLLYLRLFRRHTDTRWLIYGGILSCGLFYAASIIINCVLNIPRPSQPDTAIGWLMRGSEGKSSTDNLAVAQSVFSTLSDIYLLVIPIRSIFQLQLPTKRKLGVSAVFLIGIVAIICSLGSLSYRVKLLGSDSKTWFPLSVYIFSNAELSAGIICGCMPILPALFHSHNSSKLPFVKLQAVFMRFTSIGSRRPIVLDENFSFDQLHSDRGDNHHEEESSDRMKLKSESESDRTNLNDII